MSEGDTLLRVGGLERYHVVGAKLLHHEGYQIRWKLWLKGHHPYLPGARLIEGWSGPETEYNYIEPKYRVIEVISHRPAVIQDEAGLARVKGVAA